MLGAIIGDIVGSRFEFSNTNSTDFESAIRLAVSIGGDSDTIVAITGGIAEAYYGIPQHIQDKALSYLDVDMKNIVTKFRQKYG